MPFEDFLLSRVVCLFAGLHGFIAKPGKLIHFLTSLKSHHHRELALRENLLIKSHLKHLRVGELRLKRAPTESSGSQAAAAAAAAAVEAAGEAGGGSWSRFISSHTHSR